MNGLSDQQLLCDYAGRRSEDAFAELVRRHVDFVYSAALRMVCDAHLAEDVTQSAFVALAQNAPQLTDRPVLSGWLHRTAQNLAANAVQAAPAGLAVAMSSAALIGTTTAATLATTTMNWINIKSLTAILTAALAAGAATYMVQQRETNRLQVENRNLAAQVNTLAGERDAAVGAAGQVNGEMEQLKKDNRELLRLRGEVGVLRRQLNELARSKPENRALATRQPGAQNAASAQGHVFLSPEAGLNGCINNLRMIDAAMQQCALENKLTATNVITADQILPYLIEQKLPECPSGGSYQFGSLTNAPTCSIPGHLLASSIHAPSVELESGDVLQALIQDYSGQVPANDLAQAREAYRRDHGGEISKGILDLVPYLNPPGPRLRLAKDAYKRDHNGQAATNALDLVPFVRQALSSSR